MAIGNPFTSQGKKPILEHHVITQTSHPHARYDATRGHSLLNAMTSIHIERTTVGAPFFVPKIIPCYSMNYLVVI